MTISKRVCAECGKARERCRGTVAFHTYEDNKTFEYVCPQCWRRLEYDIFMAVPQAEFSRPDPRALIRASRPSPVRPPQF